MVSSLHQENDARKPNTKNLSRLMPPRFPIPAYCCECSVLKRAQLTRFAGQIIDGGETRNLLAMPPMEKPISWVDITTIHWSNDENVRFE